MKLNRDSKIKLMKNLVDKGWCINDIADMLQIPEASVRECYDYFATADQIETWISSGYNVKKIANMLQIPEYRVREYYDFATANKNEDEDNLNYVKLSLDKYEEVFKLGVSGYSIKEIAKMVGVSEELLRGWLRMRERIATQKVEQYAAKIRKERTRERLNSELLPCPFCGGKAEIRNETVMEPPVHYEVVFVTCLECGASTTRKISDGYYGLRCGDDEIAEMWNRRVRED